MYAAPSPTIVAPNRPQTPPQSLLVSRDSREKNHFKNTIRRFNDQLRDMDTGPRMQTQKSFDDAIQAAMLRLLSKSKDAKASLSNLISGLSPEKNKDLAALFVKISRETRLPAGLTLRELAKGERTNTTNTTKLNQAAHESFQEKLGIAGRRALSIVAACQGYTLNFKELPADFENQAHQGAAAFPADMVHARVVGDGAAEDGSSVERAAQSASDAEIRMIAENSARIGGGLRNNIAELAHETQLAQRAQLQLDYEAMTLRTLRDARNAAEAAAQQARAAKGRSAANYASSLSQRS